MDKTKVRGTSWIIVGSLVLALAATGLFGAGPGDFGVQRTVTILVFVAVGVWLLLTGLRKRRQSLGDAAKPE